MTLAPRTTVAQVLESFGDDFAEFAAAFARGEYLLWLGSGISRDVVPDVPRLLKQLLELLRTRADTTDPTCRFRRALAEVFDVADVPRATRESINLTTPVDAWFAIDDIVNRLVDRYSDVLDVQVQDEPEDFLVWTGLNVPSTYGSPELEPDVQHLCIAILMLEGVVASAPTTNWDGLVEAAMERLVPDIDRVLKVVVTPANFTEPDRQAELVKFHGCAVRARANEGECRSLLIARKSQISGWATRSENQMMKNHLEHLFASRAAFIVGLSAQDANIHTVLHEASQNLVRAWPESPAAVVFAEQELHRHHKHVLQVTYGESHAPNIDAIRKSALLGAYAKPALLGLVLFTLANKLCVLVGCVTGLSMHEVEIDRVRADIRRLRDAMAQSADVNPREFVDFVVSGMALALSIFRVGKAPNPNKPLYQPISIAPIPRALEDPDFPRAALGRLAIAVALLGRGLNEGLWTLALGTTVTPENGVVRVTSGYQTSRLFVVRDSRAHLELEREGLVDPNDDDALVVQAEAARPPTTRSPRARYGRTGKSGARHVDLEEICATVATAEALFEAFRLEGAL